LHAQTAKDAENAFRTSLKNQQLCLRNFSAQSEVDAHWDGNDVAVDKPFVAMLAAIVVKGVKVSATEVEIDGVRHQLVNDPVKGWIMATAPSNVKVLVEFNKGDAAVVLPRLKDALFFGSVNDATAAVPEDLKGSPPHYDQYASQPKSPDAALPACDCADATVDACRHDHRPITGQLPPKLVKQVDPSFSQEARSAKMSGRSTIHMKMNALGVPTFLWVAVAAGYGLDENAANAVGQYRFKPATCHSKPVATDLYIDVDFQRF
jgi:hypothetical protein